MNRVKFPISLKLILLMVVLIGTSLAGYVAYAVNLFNQDKTAYIYESGLKDVELLSKDYSQKLNDYIKLLKVVNSRTSQRVIFEDRFIEAFYVKQGTDLVREVYSKRINEGTQSLLHHFAVTDQIQAKGSGRVQYGLKQFNDQKKSLVLKIQTKQRQKVLIIDLSFVGKVMGQNRTFDNIVFNKDQGFYLQKKEVPVELRGAIKDLLFNRFDELETPSLVQDVKIAGEDYILAVKDMALAGLMGVSLIAKKDAFLATTVLVRQSVLFGLFVLSIVGFLIVLFSKLLTRPINTLYGQTLEVSNGNFDVQFEGQSRDEIGGLGKAFNDMVKKIVYYMDQMKEKARLEKEMEVAQLVQSSFFPDQKIETHMYTLEAFYEPATECGGDWWGVIKLKDRSIFMIADASGHGVPAALITAVANCCKENLKQLLASNPNFIQKPDDVLMFMNHAILNSSHDILMTAFVGILHHDTGEFVYANASHNPPFIFKHGESDHKGIKSLLSKPGARLGEKPDSVYETSTHQFEKSDYLVMFTDGFIEAESPEKKQYGNRRFLKSIIAAQTPQQKLDLNKILDPFNDFIQDNGHDDDITLLCVSFSDNQVKGESVSETNQETVDSSIFYNDKTDEDGVIKLMRDNGLCHMLGKNANEFAQELEATQKTINDQSDFLDNLITDSSVNKKFAFIDYRAALNEIETSLDSVTFDEFFDSPKSYLITLSNELISNAFYHADGQEKLRTENAVLEKEVEFRILKNKNYLAISCRDPFGSLTREMIIKNLSRAIEQKVPEQKESGAGLGFYLLYNHSNIISINVKKGQFSEISCIIDVNKRFKKYKERLTSIHLFGDLT
jgi:sigma-B regulation protein RsbU (phosphoserine phosphatase)